ncbi:MAG: hypothetical protein WC676_01595 [Candidatus Omnitrophota bacterium]
MYKPRSLENIEEKMKSLEPDSLRRHILENAKSFKSSWIELGRALYSVYRDKLYKEWGYQQFDTYTSKEIGIRKQTAMKLLRSYFFLEKEEPQYLKNEYMESAQPGQVPSYEAIDVLRLAKNKKTLDGADYANLKKNIFEKGKDVREVKKDLTMLMKQRQELDPDEAREKRQNATLRRCIGALKSLKHEIEDSGLLPANLVKDIDQLIGKIEEKII